MTEFIGRVLIPSDEKTRTHPQRAYRLPKEVSRKRVSCYVPDRSRGLHADTLRYAGTNRVWYEALNRATMRLAEFDINWIQVHGRSRFLHIRLDTWAKPVTDYANTWQRIERVLMKELELPIWDYRPRRLKWWPKRKKK